jgi:hypothetical protein
VDAAVEVAVVVEVLVHVDGAVDVDGLALEVEPAQALGAEHGLPAVEDREAVPRGVAVV